jgi:hypothetical protein
MTSHFLKCAGLIAALAASAPTRAADNGIGAFTGTSTPEVIIPPGAGAQQTLPSAPPSGGAAAPEVIIPPTTAAPQTPAYPPPIGATAPGFFGPPAPGITRMGAPRPVAPAKPPG